MKRFMLCNTKYLVIDNGQVTFQSNEGQHILLITEQECRDLVALTPAQLRDIFTIHKLPFHLISENLLISVSNLPNVFRIENYITEEVIYLKLDSLLKVFSNKMHILQELDKKPWEVSESDSA